MIFAFRINVAARLVILAALVICAGRAWDARMWGPLAIFLIIAVIPFRAVWRLGRGYGRTWTG